MRVKSSGGTLLLAASGTKLTLPDPSTVAAWTHCWDANYRELYTPDAGEQSLFGVSATPRVSRVRDSAGSKPLYKDAIGIAGFYDPNHSPSLSGAKLPGPVWLASSPRFGGRPAWHHDAVTAAGAGGRVQMPILAPVDILDSATYLNGGSGYAAPWAMALLCRPIGQGSNGDAAVDSVLGSGQAGPTFVPGNQVGTGTAWSVANWLNDAASSTITSGRDASGDETVLGIISCASGSNNSALSIYYKDANCQIQSSAVIGTLNAHAIKELFSGWVHQTYTSFLAFKSSALTAGEISALVAWAAPYLPPAGSIPVVA